jgi:hypothetical protein
MKLLFQNRAWAAMMDEWVLDKNLNWREKDDKSPHAPGLEMLCPADSGHPILLLRTTITTTQHLAQPTTKKQQLK